MNHWEKDLRDKWLIIVKDIQVATTVTMPRRYFANADLSSTAAQLHVFTDASIKAYGVVAYLQVNEQMAFVIAKTRVAPVKELTLPKLELMAALIAARVMQLHHHLSFITGHLYTPLGRQSNSSLLDSQ